MQAPQTINQYATQPTTVPQGAKSQENMGVEAAGHQTVESLN